jgi:hypothetical protein
LFVIESHIFEASPFFPNEYVSVNKKTVELKEKTIDTKRGYPEKRAVHVLAEEAFYSSQKEYDFFCIFFSLFSPTNTTIGLFEFCLLIRLSKALHVLLRLLLHCPNLIV